MSGNEVNLHLVQGFQPDEVEIHVTIENAEGIEALLFSSHDAEYASAFVRWLREQTQEPINNMRFNLNGDDDSHLPLYSALVKIGAKVNMAS